MFVSVCICTWNRADLLDRTLAEMRSARVPDGVDLEILVVDNQCTDHTAEVVRKHADALPLRRVVESKQGLSHARNRAIDESKGELILWTDDDVIVDREWLARYVEAARSRPEAVYFGGTIDPWFAVEPAPWIRSNVGMLVGPFALNQLGETDRPFVGNETPVGANMAYRREVYDGHRYDPNLGRVAGRLISGEESELVRRLKAEGRVGLWVGTAKVRHYIPAERLGKSYVGRWFEGYGATLARLDEGGACARVLGMPRWAIRSFAVESTLARALEPSKSRRWLEHFKQARTLKGLLLESRRLAKASLPAEASASPVSSGATN